MIALDTNLLVYAHIATRPEHLSARQAIQRAAEHSAGWGIPFPCVAEFWSLVTTKAAADSSSAESFLKELRRAGAQMFYPRQGSQERICETAHHHQISRNGIFDLQIAWIARDAGAKEIWTHDKGFIRLPGLKVLDPL